MNGRPCREAKAAQKRLRDEEEDRILGEVEEEEDDVVYYRKTTPAAPSQREMYNLLRLNAGNIYKKVS